MNYTYDQVLAYEVARELINSHIADCAEAMADEEAKAEASADRLAQIRRWQTGLVSEREELDMTDDAAVSRVVAKTGAYRLHRKRHRHSSGSDVRRLGWTL